MRDAIVIANEPPHISLSVDSVVYRGENKIRRNADSTAVIYLGKSFTGRNIEIGAGKAYSFDFATDFTADIFEEDRNGSGVITSKGFWITTDGAVTLVVNESMEIPVFKHTFLDMPIELSLIHI